MEQWPADIDDLIEFLPHLTNARHQVRLQVNALRRSYWNEGRVDSEGLKPLRDLCNLYDQRIDSFPEELSIRMHALPMAELLQRRRAYNLAGKQRLEYAYQCAAAQRLRGLFSNLTNYWEPEVLRGEFANLDHIDFQAIIQNLREWYAFMRDPQNIRFSAQETLERIPEYIERIEAVRDAVLARIDTMNQHRDQAFMLATHTRLGATSGVNELSQELLRDITCYSHDDRTPKRAPWRARTVF